MSQIKTGALLSYLSIFLGSAISIIYTPFMLRLMGQSEYGLVSLSNSVVGYLGLLNLGIGSAMVRYISKYKEIGDAEMEHAVTTLFLYVYFGLSVVALIIGGCLSYYVELFFDQSLTFEEVSKLRVLVALMTFNVAVGMVSSVFYAIVMAYERFIFTKAVGVINTLLTPIVNVLLLYIGYRSIGLTIASTALNLLNFLIIVVYSFNRLGFKIEKKKFDRAFLHELFGFSFFVFLAMIVDKIYWGTDQFILGAVSGTVVVAVYSVGASFNGYLMSFSTAITGLFLPRLTQMDVNHASDQEFTDLFIKVGRIQFIILSFILCGFIVFGRAFIRLWAGPDYSESYWIAIVTLVPFVIPLIQNLGLQLLYARNKHKFRSMVLFGIAVLNVALSIPLAKTYGGVGCALVTGVSYIIGQGFILNWYYHKKMRIDIPLFWRRILPLFVIACILCCLGLFAVQQTSIDSWLSLFIGVAIFIPIFIAAIWFAGMNSEEKMMVAGRWIK